MSDAALHRLGGEGPDILLIHGFGADRLSWLALAPQLFPLATVWAGEFGGHGAAGNDVGKGTLTDLAAALEAEIVGRLAEPLVDNAFIDQLPELVDGEAALALLQQLVVRKVLITRRMADAFVETLADETRRAALRTIAASLKSDAVQVLFPPACPCTVMWGASDAIVPPPNVPPKGLRMLPNVGHLPHVEAVSEVASAVEELLDGAFPPSDAWI